MPTFCRQRSGRNDPNEGFSYLGYVYLIMP